MKPVLEKLHAQIEEAGRLESQGKIEEAMDLAFEALQTSFHKIGPVPTRNGLEISKLAKAPEYTISSVVTALTVTRHSIPTLKTFFEELLQALPNATSDLQQLLQGKIDACSHDATVLHA